MPLEPKPPSVSATEMVQVVLPNDANPMGLASFGSTTCTISVAEADGGLGASVIV